MAFFSEIYASNILGKRVLTTDENIFGKVIDLVVNLEGDGNSVSKLVVRTRKGAVTISWDYVQSIEVDFLNIKLRPGFDAQPWTYLESEFYVKRGLLDQQVVDTKGRKVVRVNDVKFAEIKGSMVMVAFDIGPRGLLRRLGWESFISRIARLFNKRIPEILVNIEDTEMLVPDSQQKIHLKVPFKKLSKLHPADFADIIEQLDTKIQLQFLNNLSAEKAAEVFQELERKYQLSLIKEMNEERAADVIEQMDADDATDLLGEMEESVAEDIIDEMEEETANEIRELMKFDPDTAGGLMTTEFITVYDYLKVSDAVDYIRGIDKKKIISYYIYAVDANEKLTGVFSLKSLFTANPGQLVTELLSPDLITIKPDEEAKEALKKIAKYDILAVPVVDEEGKILGIVTVDDAIDILDEEVEQ